MTDGKPTAVPTELEAAEGRVAIMDAVRLIAGARRALARALAQGEGAVMAEAWQAQVLVEAVGGHLALRGDPALRAGALALCQPGAAGCVPGPLPPGGGPRAGPPRAARLTVVRDPPAALSVLLDLLDEVVAALVEIVCRTEDEPLYWQCIEAVDAAGEARERVRALLASCEKDKS